MPVIVPASGSTTFIYTLCDPDTLAVRYVGKADDPAIRFKNHLKEKRNNHKVHWINQLKSQNKKPLLKVVEEVPKSCWEEHEKKWIAYYKNVGCNLTNSTEGGERVQFTEEIRKKISQARMGHTVSEETRKKISLINLSLGFEHRKKLSDAHKGIPISLGTLKNLRKMAEKKRGLPLAEDHRLKIARANTGKKHNDATRLKLSITTSQYMSKPGIREKQRATCKKQWSDPEYRKKRSEETRKLWENPEYRRRLSEAHRRKT